MVDMSSVQQIRPVQPTAQTATALAALACVLLVINIAFVYSAGWSKLVWSILGYGGLFMAFRLGKLTPADCGLEKLQVKIGAKYGAIAAAIVLAGSLVLFVADKNFFMDPRYHHSLAVALYAAIVLLPLKTVL